MLQTAKCEGSIWLRQCTQPKRTKECAWYKEKSMLAEAQEAGQILDEEQLAFLAYPRILADQAQTIIPHNAAFQTEDLDTYDSDCDDLSTAQAVLMVNISIYGFDIISACCREKMIDSQMDDMIREKLALKEQIDSLEQNLSKQIKEKESLFKTLTDDFEKHFSPQQELSAEQALWFHILNPSIESSYTAPVIVEVPSELPKEVFQNNESCVNHNGVEIQEYFEIKDLKARLQEKDTTIWKLKDTIKSLSKNTKEENVNHDKCELEPINEELENSVAKLLSENERLYNEINNVKQGSTAIDIPSSSYLVMIGCPDCTLFQKMLDPRAEVLVDFSSCVTSIDQHKSSQQCLAPVVITFSGKSRIKVTLDTKPNSELIHYCLQNPPYTYQWAEKTVPVAEGSSETTTERLKQGESINVQDLETNLYWEFGKFTSRDVNIHFLLQLQPEWQRFVTLVKQSQELKNVSNHKLYDILKQHQNEVNEIRAKRLARTANPLALVAQQQPVFTSSKSHPTQNTQYPPTDQPPPPNNLPETEGKALLPYYTRLMIQNLLRTSSNTNRANQDNSPRINRGTGYDNQRAVNVAGARENVAMHKVQNNNDNYNVFAMENGNILSNRILSIWNILRNMVDTYITIDSLDICNDRAQDDQDDTDDLDQERDLLASLIQKLKCVPWCPNTPLSSNLFAARRDNLFIIESRCSKHIDGNLKLLTNFVEKFLGTVKFGNDQIAPILGYGDLVQGTISIKRVYYVEGLNHNLFSVGQFCDADLEVAFRKSTCYIRDLKGNDLLTGSRGTDLYSISLQDSTTPNPICLMAKATSSQAWLWHRRLSHLNFDTINLILKNNIMNGLPKLKFFKDHMCSSCELGKAKIKSFHAKTTPSSKRRLQLLHMDLCGPMRVESINGKKYVLIIVDDYSRYTWTHFLRSKDETPGVLIDFLTLVQRGLHAQVTTVRTDKGTEFLNKTLHAYFAKEGIRHEMSTARTPE
ncbi:retrovirus-related pol polyprotein from transposon TNT 1-94 [Tanacetum coccineum]